jgi:hypothetical protein
MVAVAGRAAVFPSEQAARAVAFPLVLAVRTALIARAADV